MRTPFMSEILEARQLLSSAALQSDGTLRIFINDPEATIAVVHGKLRVNIAAVRVELLDPENPDSQYHNVTNAVFKNFDLTSVKRLDISTTQDGSTSDFDTSFGTPPFFKNMTALPATYTGTSIFDPDYFQFGSGDDDVTHYRTDAYVKNFGRLVFDYRDTNAAVSSVPLTNLGFQSILDPITQARIPVYVYLTNFADSMFAPLDGHNIVVFSGAGNDSITTGYGNDVINSGGGADNIYSGPGNDTLNGEDGNDLLVGEAGDDKLYGGAGNDKIFGGAGRDTLIGGAGNDRMNGQSGSDLYYANDGEADVLTDILGGTNRAYADLKDRLINTVAL